MCSIWQTRRVLITKEYISFAFVRMDEEIDRIPLEDVDFVKAHFEAAVMESQDDSQSQDFFCFQVATRAEGYNSGRTYTLRTRSKELYDEILPLLIKMSKKARRRAEARTFFRKCQWKVRKIYTHYGAQSFIALIIMGVSIEYNFPPSLFRICNSTQLLRVRCQSFSCTIVEAQYSEILSSDKDLADLLDKFNLLFTAFFTLELFVSAFSFWLLPFLRDPWSWLDAFVVRPTQPAVAPAHARETGCACIERICGC